MPARGAPKAPTSGAIRDAWLHSFEAELLQLRPHLEAIGRKVVRTVALQQHAAHADEDPLETARAYHAANPVR